MRNWYARNPNIVHTEDELVNLARECLQAFVDGKLYLFILMVIRLSKGIMLWFTYQEENQCTHIHTQTSTRQEMIVIFFELVDFSKYTDICTHHPHKTCFSLLKLAIFKQLTKNLIKAFGKVYNAILLTKPVHNTSPGIPSAIQMFF